MDDDAYEFFRYLRNIKYVPGPHSSERYRELARRKWWLCGADPAKFDDWWRNYFRSGGMWGRYTFTSEDYAYFNPFTKDRYFFARTPQPYQAVAVKMGGQIYIPLTQVKNKYQSAAFNLSIDTPIAIAVPPGEDPQGQVDEWAARKKSIPPASVDGAVFINGITSQAAAFSPDNMEGSAEFAYYWRPNGLHDYKNMGENNKNKHDHNGKYYDYPSMYDAYGNFAYGTTGAAYGYNILELTSFAAGVRNVGYAWGDVLDLRLTAIGRDLFASNNPINRQDIKSGFDAISNGGKLIVFEYDPARYRDQLNRYTMGGKLIIDYDNLAKPIGLQAARYTDR